MADTQDDYKREKYLDEHPSLRICRTCGRIKHLSDFNKDTDQCLSCAESDQIEQEWDDAPKGCPNQDLLS